MQNYQEKQEFLRKTILEAGFDAEEFVSFMGRYKSQGQNVDLNNWTMEELQQLVNNFRNSNNNRFEATQTFKFNTSRLQEIDNIMKSRMSVLFIKPKLVTYCLQDYDIQTKQKQIQLTSEEIFESLPCSKISKPFRLSSKKNIFKINCEKFDIVQNPGYIFGIGAYKDVWITLNTNFTETVVTRKIEDFQFVKNLLRIKFPGLMIPPLKNLKKFHYSNKDQIAQQVTKVMNFINDITKNEILFQNLYIQKFLTETNYKKFQAHKARNQIKVVQNIKSSICQIQSVSGQFQVQISNKIEEFMRNAKFLQQNYQNCYKNVYNSFSKVKQHLKKASVQMNNVIGSYEILQAFLNKIHSILDRAQINQPNIKCNKENMNSTLYSYINEFQKNLQSNFNQIQQFMQNYQTKIFKKSHQIIEQFSIAMKDVRQSRKKYLQNRIQVESKSGSQKLKSQQKEKFQPNTDNDLALWQGYLNSNLVYSFYFMESTQKQILNSLLQKYFKKLDILDEDRSKILDKIQKIPKNDSYSRILSSYMKIDEVSSNQQR